ncbi:MAG: helix-turn-helix domain-containing protein [Candidatus Sulfotelmatobacter sp.]
MTSGSLAKSHHGEILCLQNVANCRIFASRHPPGLIVPKHTHDRTCIGFVVEGRCEERLSNRVMDLSQHKLFFRPAGEIHANRAGSNGFLCLIAEVPDGWLEHIRDYAALPSQPCCFQNADLSWLSLRLYQECRLGGFASPLAIEGLMLEVAAGLLRQQRLDPHCHSPLWLRRATEALHAHCHESLRLSMVAAWVGVHPVHLAREFRKRHGCTVGHYVRRLRIESASRRLVDSDSPLAAIALEVGFANQAHFSRIFKSVTGISPARYRADSRTANRRHHVSIR